MKKKYIEINMINEYGSWYGIEYYALSENEERFMDFLSKYRLEWRYDEAAVEWYIHAEKHESGSVVNQNQVDESIAHNDAHGSVWSQYRFGGKTFPTGDVETAMNLEMVKKSWVGPHEIEVYHD
jgi:hypothetical protein